MIARLPQVKSLDGTAVTDEERSAASAALQHEALVLDLMLSNTCLLFKLVRFPPLANEQTSLLLLLYTLIKAP